MERYFRVFKFAGEVMGMGSRNKTLFKPIMFNIGIAAPLNLLLALAYGLIHNGAVQYVVLAFGVAALYFTDYFCNALTVSLIHDEVTKGNATLGNAFERVKKSIGGIVIFASVSAALDLLASYAQERDDIVGKILAQIVYAVWTTATYVIMPAMIIEGAGFGEAFTRSKDLAKEDPTQVGAGVVGIGIVNWALGAACFFVAYMGLGALSRLGAAGGILGAMFFFTMVNVYWAVSGFLKITYFTCFYLWARECERRHGNATEWAPAPLAATLA